MLVIAESAHFHAVNPEKQNPLHDDTRVTGDTLKEYCQYLLGLSFCVWKTTYGPELSSLLSDWASNG